MIYIISMEFWGPKCRSYEQMCDRDWKEDAIFTGYSKEHKSTSKTSLTLIGYHINHENNYRQPSENMKKKVKTLSSRNTDTVCTVKKLWRKSVQEHWNCNLEGVCSVPALINSWIVLSTPEFNPSMYYPCK